MDQIKVQDTAMYQTKDYNSFKILNYNRAIDESRIEGLMKSIKENGFLLPILVSQDMQIADGQHRLAAAKRLNVPVSYIKYNISGNNLPILISTLNSLSKNWKLSDYYMMWKELGKNDYIWMSEIIEYYDLTFVEFFKLFSGSIFKISNKFKNGTITFTQSQKDRIINLVKNFNSIINFSDVFKGEGFGKIFRLAVLDIVKHPDYDNERMLRKLRKDAGRLLGCVNRIDFIQQLEHVYNHGERNQIDFIRSKTKKATIGKVKIKQKSL